MIGNLRFNAGIMVSKPLEELDVAEWDRVLNVNLRGAFLCVKYGLPWMRKAGGGSVVNIASTRALMSELASDDAGFITGANLVVDGGMTVKMIYV